MELNCVGEGKGSKGGRWVKGRGKGGKKGDKAKGGGKAKGATFRGECNTCGKVGHRGADCRSGLPHNQYWDKKRQSTGKGAAALEEQDASSLEMPLLGMGMTDNDGYDAGGLSRHGAYLHTDSLS